MRISIHPWLRGALLLTGAGLLCKILIAHQVGVLADEAYYWTWSKEIDLGYFDQPPMIAWLMGWSTHVLGDSPLALRALAILSGIGGWLALRQHCGDRGIWAAWWLLAPPLFWLTLFATPDAYLLCFWACALAGACHGGRAWWVAGLFIGLAGLTKYTGILLLPLLAIAAPSKERWGALTRMLIPACLLWTPHALWLLEHRGISLSYALEEGLGHAHPPGLFGLVEQLVEQALVWTPIVFALGLIWLYKARPWSSEPTRAQNRVQRIAWWSSAPVVLFFWLASPLGPPEAHWPAPAWIGIGLALSHAQPRHHRGLWTGLWFGGLVSAMALVHGLQPLTTAEWSPYHRQARGKALAQALTPWVMPIGALPHALPADEGPIVWTERYQEASLLRYHLGINAWVAPSCGRKTQYGLWNTPVPRPTTESVWFIRPTTSGPPRCAEDLGAVGTRHIVHGRTIDGHITGKWDLWEVHAE